MAARTEHDRQTTWWWLLMAAGLALAAAGDWRALVVPPFGLGSGAAAWACGLCILGLSAWLADRGRPRVRSWTWADTASVAAVMLAAAVYRLWRFSEYPPPDAFGFEEFQTGGLAFDAVRDWTSLSLEFPLTNLMPAISFRIFGLSANALRLPFLVSGTLAPVFLYCALRRLVERPAAWSAAMLLASNRWAAATARFADEIFFPVSIVALAAWLLVCVLQERRYLLTFVFAAVSADLFYAYSGYRVLPLIGAGGVGLLAARQAGRQPEIVRLAALGMGVWLVLLGPGMVTRKFTDRPLFLEALERHADAWGGQTPMSARVMTGVRRLYQGWAVFAREGDEFATVNVPLEPMFDPVTAAFATVAVLVAAYRWRDPGRALALAMVVIPFLAVALIPVNFNVERYFVLVVPLFFLVGYFLNDLLLATARRGAGVAAIGVGTMLVALLNFYDLQRLIDSPVVRESFVQPENTVLAAIHAIPAGSEVRLLTREGSNALEESDYRWFTAHLNGERPRTLPEALTVDSVRHGPIYWLTQGPPEAAVLPELVASRCRAAQSTIHYADKTDAVVGIAWVNDGELCGAPATQGLRGTYRIEEPDGRTRSSVQVDPVLFAYTIPWDLSAQFQDGIIRGLNVDWTGSVTPRDPGVYGFRLELLGANGRLRVGEQEVSVSGSPEVWRSAELSALLSSDAVPVSIGLEGLPRSIPRVRLYWTPPQQSPQLVPPSQLSPAG
jgi:dolichyl-phosphate-mannose-protein mannosyltransferase